MERLTKEQLENYRNTYDKFDGVESNVFEKICDEHLEKYDYSECACAYCPLWLKNDNYCARDFAWINYKYGNNEINFKECEE